MRTFSRRRKLNKACRKAVKIFLVIMKDCKERRKKSNFSPLQQSPMKIGNNDKLFVSSRQQRKSILHCTLKKGGRKEMSMTLNFSSKINFHYFSSTLITPKKGNGDGRHGAKVVCLMKIKFIPLNEISTRIESAVSE